MNSPITISIGVNREKQDNAFSDYQAKQASTSPKQGMNLRVSKGSFSADHREFPGVRCVPIAEAQAAVFRVSFGENRPSDSVDQGRLRAHSGRLGL